MLTLGGGTVEPGWYAQVSVGYVGGIAFVFRVEPVEIGGGVYTWRPVGPVVWESGISSPLNAGFSVFHVW